MIRLLTRLFGRPDTASIVECRRCGTTLESGDVDRCSECGSSEIVTYRL
ncbi:small CPxCG-related zinc finger protein (plasmid) [Halobacterium hubeiense]|uniref:Small CPxCG-related zinc finger protein n=1 Tax=Halobacterium hubeiense TaxID=1407499 RepID=A0A0U5H9K6_9EURY|nr:small CPxCG-related zinc finger protein [Halobacterium hubeiense]